MKEDYYRILGIKKDATIEEIKIAFRIKVKLYHPDQNPMQSKEDGELFTKISEAWETLSDPVKRKFYDNGVKFKDIETTAILRVQTIIAKNLLNLNLTKFKEDLKELIFTSETLIFNYEEQIENFKKMYDLIILKDKKSTKENIFNKVISDKIQKLKDGMVAEKVELDIFKFMISIFEDYKENDTSFESIINEFEKRTKNRYK